MRVELAIAMSGAHLDLGENERALQELEIPELDPNRAFEWSPSLFAARAAVLEELGRVEEAQEWQHRAIVAAEALDAADGSNDREVVYIDEVIEQYVEGLDDTSADDTSADDAPADDAAPSVPDEDRARDAVTAFDEDERAAQTEDQN